MRLIHHFASLSVLLALFGTSAFAQKTTASQKDLLMIYQEAQKQDPTYLAAQATLKANEEDLPIAIAALLPQVTSTGESSQTRENDEHFYTNEYDFTLTQSIFSLANWKSVSAAHASVAEAAATYAQAKQTLILDVATAYFNVLSAEDELTYAKANQATLKEQLNQTQQRYKVGLVSISDVEATKADYDTARAETISDKNTLADSFESLAEITGKVETHLAPLSALFPFKSPKPTNINAWATAAEKGNPNLIAYQYAAKEAHANVGVQVSNFLPSVSGTALKDRAVTSEQSEVHDARTTSYTGTASINLFAGGGDYAAVKQYHYLAASADQNTISSKRSAISTARQDYLSVLADISSVSAYKQAVISSQSSLEAIQAGYKVGTETIFNVLDAQSQLFESQQLYSAAKYQYIIDRLNLEADVGTLDEKDVMLINHGLAEHPTPSSHQ